MLTSRRPAAVRLLRWSLARLGYGNDNPATNGEYRLLDELPELPTVFDVGAHRGDYAFAVLDRRPNAIVHCFEPAAETFRLLATRVGGRARLHCVALSDSSGNRTLFGDRVGSAMASLFRRDLDWLGIENSVEETVKTETLDDVCAAENIDHIDLLKIDAEGSEHLVLLGARRMLDGHRIARIMFEYGGTALDSHFFMRDFYRLLDGFTLYRVLPDGLLPLGRYGEHLEIAAYSNYCAIRVESGTD
jgi:FkbM family methyltransferase